MTDARRLSRETYARAERFLAPNARRLVFQTGVVPHWIGDSDRFWYRNETAHGVEFVLVDPERGERPPAFDHAKLAAALSVRTGKPYRAGLLPFDEIAVDDGGQTIRFDIDGQRWAWDVDHGALHDEGDRAGEPENEVPSPDGQWFAFVRDHDLFVRGGPDGREIRLTDDGEADNDYATPLPSPLPGAGIRSNRPMPSGPAVIWSPDGTRLITHRIDSRDAGRFHLVQSVPLDGSLRPALHSYVYPLPGDDNTPRVELIIFDLDQRKRLPVSGVTPPLLYYGTPLRAETVWWSEDGSEVYLFTRERGYLSYTLWSVNAETGDARRLVSEESETGIEPYIAHGGDHNIRVIGQGQQVVWYSQRDGWGHLYLYDRDGRLIRQLTAGPWSVVAVKHVDEANDWIYFTAVGREAGRDPYFQHLHRTRLDADGEPELLTPEDASHDVSFAPSGRYFVDGYSRVDQAPIAVLRTADGDRTLELERADISRLLATGWRPPERFSFKARDGVTDVYGVLLLPTHFDSAGKLPVIDDIYAGPQTNRAPVSFGGSSSTSAGLNAGFWHAQALAELGFAVVSIDGLGMPYRAKAFHDRSYRDLGDAGLAEHILGIRHLAERYPFLDLDRVGIFGHSAGGYSSAHAILKYPEFYKVAVSSAGNHDHRLDKATWVERYMGLPVGEHYVEQANSTLAANLRGKLLLIHGEMDENVHPASTMRLVNALIQANKDFDLLIYPNQPHGVSGEPYFIRRRWDYFVRHLLGAEQPADYQLMRPED